MMTWNYRLIQHDKSDESWFAVHEVYYNDDGSINGYTAEPVGITGDTVEDAQSAAQMLLKDITTYPVLKESEVVFVDDDIPDFLTEEEEELLTEAELDDFYNSLDDSAEIIS